MLVETALRVCEYRAGSSMAAHCHAEATLNLVVRGAFRERIGRHERDYARGHIAFCPAGVTHAQSFGADGAQQIIFRPQECWLDYLCDSKTDLEDAPHANSALFRHLGDRLLQEMHHGDAFSAVARESILLEIVARFGRHNAAQSNGVQPPTWLRAARDYLHARACAPLRMADIASAAGRHEIHLAREFRRYFGVSVGTYLRRLRTGHASRLLLQPDASISEIALASGFSSHSHLCREFKAQFGVTPSQYRARSRG
ncbi:MAG TPA: AraC family transcriptional regulator [Rhizomicrobium sp.]|jgi:AraC family transcriptional regulator